MLSYTRLYLLTHHHARIVVITFDQLPPKRKRAIKVAEDVAEESESERSQPSKRVLYKLSDFKASSTYDRLLICQSHAKTRLP